MDTLHCPHCKLETSNEYNFCIHCDKQIKCLNVACGKILVGGKDFCFGCGQPLAAIGTSSGQPNTYARTITKKGKDYDERTEFRASDFAVSALASFIGGQIFSPERSMRNVSNEELRLSHAKALPPTPNNLGPQRELALDVETTVPVSQSAQAPAAAQTGATKHFMRDGDKLVAQTKDFKGKTWAEQQRNFIILYAAAYSQTFGTAVPKTLFKTVTEKSGLADPNNFTRYVASVEKEYFVILDQGVKLNPAGEKESKAILDAIDNDTITAGYAWWNRTTSSSSKKHYLTGDDKIKLNSWANENIDIGKLDPASIQQAADYALLAVWIIIAHLKKSESVTWNEAYYFYKEKFKAIAASPETFSAAVRKDSNKYFRHADDGKLFLTPEGQKKVERWISEGFTEKQGEK